VHPALGDGTVVLDRYPARSTPETVRQAFEGWAAEWSSNGPSRTFAPREAATNVLAGGVQVRLRESGVAHLSYWVFAQFRGRGFATRGLRLAAAWALGELGVERLELYIEPDKRREAWLVLRGSLREKSTENTSGSARRCAT